MVSASNGSGSSARKRWTERREPKAPSLFDEWKMEEAERRSRSSSIRRSTALETASPATVASRSTIRALTPEHQDEEMGSSGARTSSRAESVPSQTTTPTHTTAILPTSSTSTSPSRPPRKLTKDRVARLSTHGSSGSRSGAGLTGMLGRNTSKSKSRGDEAEAAVTDNAPTSPVSRLRARTLEEMRPEAPSTTAARHSRRMGSLNHVPNPGADYLASVPAEVSPPSAPSVYPMGSGDHYPLDYAGRRSISPTGSITSGSYNPAQGKTTAKRILHLMKTLNGRYQGTMLFRLGSDRPWKKGYCYVVGESGALIATPETSNDSPHTIMPSLKGCRVKPGMDGATPILQLALPPEDSGLEIKLLTQVDFDSWYAAFLHWTTLSPGAPSASDAETPPRSAGSAATPPRPPPRTSSAKKSRHRHTNSEKSERRRSSFKPKDAPVIKIGKMIYWDTTAVYTNAVPHPPPDGARSKSTRPQTQRTQSNTVRQWRRINGQLRENGELTLSSDPDNSLISVVQLSQLSRCAIQRLDPSVMNDAFCIAVYPQYTATSPDNQLAFARPIFLSLENRVLYEVWFVLLRAFTIPQLYGPSASDEDGEEKDDNAPTSQELESIFATKTTDMFRMERSLSVRIVEARMFPIASNASLPSQGFVGAQTRTAGNSRSEQYGYYAEVLLDNETRAKTTTKFDGLAPLWAETFDFFDLPPVLNSASVVVKRRTTDTHAREQLEQRVQPDFYSSAGEVQGVSTGFGFDVVCGKVEIYLQELDGEKDIEKWWPIMNASHQHVGDVLIRARAEESVILMARDYEPLGEVLRSFENNVTLQIAQMIPAELKSISDTLLDIFQVSGKASEWLMALIEEEIDGMQNSKPVTKPRFGRRVGSESGQDVSSLSASNPDREAIVRDMNKHAALEANLLFRGNTLLTKSLDSHMRRFAKDYLEASLGGIIREINAKDPQCEVDPSKVENPHEVTGNWRRLLLCTQEVWKAIVAAKHRCPIELRVIFRHIRACAEDRYGDFMRNIAYSSVSGFLFLRFFCPAILNPKLFGLMNEDVKPHARRACVLIAKSLQTLSNLASFGAKETWMEPMNAFLQQNRTSFKALIEDVCTVPISPSAGRASREGGSSPETFSAESNLSYTTPITIMARLPPTSREGFPSLPFLIDQPRAYAELVQLWLEATTVDPESAETSGAASNMQAEVQAAIQAAGPHLVAFHEICTALHTRTQDCLNRAERAERPDSASSFPWDELIDQLKPDLDTNPDDLSDDAVPTDRHVDGPSIPPGAPKSAFIRMREWDMVNNGITRLQNQHPPLRGPGWDREHPRSSGVFGSLHESLRRAHPQSAGSDSASVGNSVGNASSAPSSDTEHLADSTPTALPSYERELRHRERREAAKQQIQQHVAAASRTREAEREGSGSGGVGSGTGKKKGRSPIVSALRKKNHNNSLKENGRVSGGAAAAAAAGPPAEHAATN